MKIIIGYDGSECANNAVSDLRLAGLPPDTEAIVLSAADIWPARPEWTFDESSTDQQRRMSLSERTAYEIALDAMRRARAAARDGVARTRDIFPEWRIEARPCPGPPAASLIDEAIARKADLIVVGSRGKSLLRGMLLGSVSRRVLAHAPCSVRVGRLRKDDQPRSVRIVLGMDGSHNAHAAARAIASRRWPAGSEVRIVAALDVHLITARATVDLVTGESSLRDPGIDARTWIGRICHEVANELGAAGLATSVIVKEDDATAALLGEAESIRSDCIFVGATGLRGLQRFVIGSVSRTVAEHGACSVEVARPAAA